MKQSFAIIILIMVLFSCEKDYHREVVYGYFTDTRDSTDYSTITIKGRTWMSENLAYLPGADSLHEFSETGDHYYLLEYSTDTSAEPTQEEYHREFGVLYNWMAALSSCPEGWRLPSDYDWKILERHLGMNSKEADEATGWRVSGNVDIKLKSTYGWYKDENGTNASGFNARPAAFINPPLEIDTIGHSAFFWSSTIDLETGLAWSRGLRSNQIGIARYTAKRSRGMSVRCIKDN